MTFDIRDQLLCTRIECEKCDCTQQYCWFYDRDMIVCNISKCQVFLPNIRLHYSHHLAILLMCSWICCGIHIWMPPMAQTFHASLFDRQLPRLTKICCEFLILTQWLTSILAPCVVKKHRATRNRNVDGGGPYDIVVNGTYKL